MLLPICWLISFAYIGDQACNCPVFLGSSSAHDKEFCSYRTSTSPRSVATRTASGFSPSSGSPAPTSLSHLPFSLTCLAYLELQHHMWRKEPFKDCLTSSHNCIHVRPSFLYPRGSASLIELSYKQEPNGKAKCLRRNFSNALLFFGGLPARVHYSLAQVWTISQLGRLHEACKI